jgi:hypothetical protein
MLSGFIAVRPGCGPPRRARTERQRERIPKHPGFTVAQQCNRDGAGHRACHAPSAGIGLNKRLNVIRQVHKHIRKKKKARKAKKPSGPEVLVDLLC